MIAGNPCTNQLWVIVNKKHTVIRSYLTYTRVHRWVSSWSHTGWRSWSLHQVHRLWRETRTADWKVLHQLQSWNCGPSLCTAATKVKENAARTTGQVILLLMPSQSSRPNVGGISTEFRQENFAPSPWILERAHTCSTRYVGVSSPPKD